MNKKIQKSFTTAIFIVLCLLLLTEVILRYFKLEPTVNDNENLWSINYSKVTNSSSNSNSNSVALLGNSRMLTNFDVQQANELFTEQEFIQLGILGSSPVPILKDIALSTSFKGLVVVALWEPDIPKNMERTSSPYLSYYKSSFSFNEKVNVQISTFLESNFVLLHSFYNLRNNLVNLILWREPTKMYVRTDKYRSRDADYSLLDIQKHRQSRINKVKRIHNKNNKLTKDQYFESAQELAKYARKIESRGGRVIFVYFPLSGETASHIHKLYPRKLYWNRLSSDLGLTTIHYQDYQGLKFKAPDTSHLDIKDKDNFTINLLNIIKPYLKS